MTRSTKAALLGASALALVGLSSWATQDAAARLQFHPALGQRFAFGLYEPFGWIAWQFEPWASGVAEAFMPSRLGFMGLMLAVGLAVYGEQTRRRKPRAYPATHGTAKFATEDEIRDAGLIGGRVGIYLGAWEDAAGNVHYIRTDGNEHTALIAPSRTGKGVGPVVMNLLSWPESAVIIDEKTELYELTAGWRKSIGQRVLRWQPGSPVQSCGFNPLAEVRLGTDYEVADAESIAIMVVDPDGKGLNDHWKQTAFAFISGLIIHVMYRCREAGKLAGASLPLVAYALSDPTRPIDELYAEMEANAHRNGERHEYIAVAGTQQIKRADRERTSVLSACTTHLHVFLDPIVARNMSRSDFRLSDIMDGPVPTSLYIVIQQADKARLRPLVRLAMAMIVRKVLEASPVFDGSGRQLSPHKWRCLGMFDEMPSYRHLEAVKSSPAQIAGWGFFWFFVMQDREQLIDEYGEHEAILSNCGAQIAFAPNTVKTAEWLSAMTGTSTVTQEVIAESGRKGGILRNITRSMQHVSRPLMTADETRNLRSAKKDGTRIVEAGQTLVFVRRLKILAGQLLYFIDPTFEARSRIPPPRTADTNAERRTAA